MAENSDSGKTGKTSGGRTRKTGGPSAETDVRRAGSQPRTTNAKSPAIKGAAGGGPQKTGAELFPIVGIGASAGGLEALTELLRAMPDDPGIAVVYIQHMAPTHESMLPRLLAKATSMPVLEVTDGMKVQANHLYIIPPNAGLTISEGFLRLSVRKEGGGKILPIDDFFCALAEDQRTAAIGVILSGTASDGTLGLKAIKAEGGITFTQDSKSARFPDMPLSAVAAGCVDFTLPPDKIAAELSRMGRHPYIRAFKEAEPPQAVEGPDESLRKICLLLRSATGVDFHLYKPATISRRVARRMALHRVSSRDKYLHLLRENRNELDALYEDIFIHVTGFFRDPEALVAVRHTVLPNILEERPSDQAIRVWVPGCSSGEEVYSIAIMLLEELGERANQTRIQTFGTDISEKAIEHARAGIYSESSVAGISAERRRRFFVKVEGGYQISKFVRDMCVFARHDVTKDPPFSKLDIICCRNVLIYLGPVLQKRVAETFHYALKGSGYLVLGKSESLSAHANLFAMEDAKLKIFSRKPIPGPHYLNTTIAEFVKAERAGLAPPAGGSFDLRREAERLLLDQFVPPALVVDADLQIVHFQGDTSRYLAPATGQPSFHLLRMVRPEAVVDLRTAIHEAKKTGSAVRREGVRIKHNGGYKTVDLRVLPLKGRHAKEIDFLIIFQETVERIPGELLPLKGEKKGKDKGAASQRIEQLRRELGAAHEQLKTIIEEHEATSEEMTAVNEEVISSNEELQSTNEELETAKEELQSSNEELITLNDELQNRNSELGQLANDLSNLLVGVEIPIVILDSDLRIRRFTPVAEKVLNLISTDVGRPFTDLAPTLDVTDWKELIDQVVQSRSVVERDVRDRQGHWYGLRMRPYQTSEHKIDGILMALVDIDTIKRSLDEAREARDFAEAIVETVREPLLILDERMRVLKATRSFYETFHTSPEDTEGLGLFDLGGGSWNIPRLRELMGQVLPRDVRVEAFEVTQEFPVIGHRDMLLNAARIHRPAGGKPMMLLAIEDVTERRQAEDVIRQRERVFQEATSQALVSAASDGKITMVNQRAAEMFGYSREELLNLTVEALLPASSREAHAAKRSAYLSNPLSRAMASGLEVNGRRKDGSEFPISVTLSHIDTQDGAIAIDIISDLSERRKAEVALKLSQERLLLAQETAGIALWDWDGQSGEVRHSRDWGPLYGLPRGAEANTPEEWLAMVHPDDRARVLESRKRALENGAPFSEEFRAVWPDGSVHWLQGRATVFQDPDRKAVRMVGVNVDITSRKKAEEERQMLLDRLTNAQEAERRRISRELHDNLTQKLASLAIDLGRLAETSAGSVLQQRVRALQTEVVQAAEAARHIAHELHPSELEDLGLAAALRAYCEDFRRQGIKVEFTERGLHQTVSREIASCLYKVAQEGLRNVAKYGKTKQASVTLEGAGDWIRLRVEDRGSGFPVESLAGTAGLGIPTMKERVRLMNGNFEIHSKPGQGTQISVELPL